MAPYPECIDWLQFREDNAYEQMQWRIDTIRAVDQKNLITAHGISGSVPIMASNGCNDWLAASKVEVYGFTWVQARKGSEPWKSWYGVDIVRAAARGKPFWHAERQGGPLWLQPQVIGRDKEDGRVATPDDVRIWSMISLAGGARGIMNLRMRPLLDGPLFGAFGSYAMDGSRTPRSDMASGMAKWANEPAQAAVVARQARARRDRHPAGAGDAAVRLPAQLRPAGKALSGRDVGRLPRLPRQWRAARLGAYRRYRRL